MADSWSTVATPDLSKNRKKRKMTLGSYGGDNSWSGTSENINMLQQVYRGRYDRLERYKLYDWMDSDSDISRALDLIAEHCTDKNDDGQFWDFDWTMEPTEEESALLKENLDQWTKINEWDQNRLFRSIRNVMKYGDEFFFRNPDTFELYRIHPKHVLGALVHPESVEVVAWIVRNFTLNTENLELAVDNKGLQDNIKSLSLTSGFRNTKVIPAIHMVHLTLSEGKFAGASSDDDPSDRYNNRWPFGESWLEQASKTFKQRELLEDATLIHRVQRAPSRTVWYIDTGKARSDRASWMVHNFKNELNQKRIPQFIGQDGKRTVDSVYNPISQLEDIYIPVSFEQRGSKVETLEGQPWNELPDLQYFTKKMMRALRVPHSWLLGPEEGGSVFNDGRVGVAYQEEIEFSKFCTRVQKHTAPEFDTEFKIYCKIRDVNVMASDFEMTMVPPTNYDDFKQNARDQDNINVWASVKDEPDISRRFSRKKYLNWTDDDIVENERMVLEERFSPKDANDFAELGGPGGGFGGGALPPPTGGELGLGSQGPGGFGDLSGADLAGGGIGGDMSGGAGMGAAAGGAPMGGGGFGESRKMKKRTLKEFSADDMKAAKPAMTDTPTQETPDDDLFPVGANVEGSPDWMRGGGFKITLKMLQDVRKSHMSRRIETEKRLKMIQKVYQTPTEEGPGGLGGGLGGGL